MSVQVIALAVICGLLLLFIVGLLLGFPVPGFGGSARNQLSKMVESQRRSVSRTSKGGKSSDASIYDTAKEARVENVKSSVLTLEKKLRYAQWTLPPLGFRLLEIGISLLMAFIVSLKFNKVMVGMSLLSGPLFMRWLLNKFIDRRFKAFDSDYPAFLMNLVSLLRTGMNTMNGMEAAAKALDEDSLVRAEVMLMLERLKYGVAEEKSIGSFAEDIYHEEIELFVQALLLSRRVGGNLSDTLDRLAKQVRKRQYFRASARAAVGLQRGSIAFILAIMAGMEVYLYFVYPEAIVKAIKDPTGWQVWQFGLTVILLGMFWVRQVTKIRV
jgi:tight adherence protein B